MKNRNNKQPNALARLLKRNTVRGKLLFAVILGSVIAEHWLNTQLILRIFTVTMFVIAISYARDNAYDVTEEV